MAEEKAKRMNLDVKAGMIMDWVTMHAGADVLEIEIVWFAPPSN